MSLQAVKEYFTPLGVTHRILELPQSSATVELAAQDLGCEGARIAKTLAFHQADAPCLIVMAGDAKVDNGKYKAAFHEKAKMLSPEETLEQIGHAVGGVCPFGIDPQIPVFLDCSLKRFESVFPACGSGNSAIELTLEELAAYSHSRGWVDVCRGWI